MLQITVERKGDDHNDFGEDVKIAEGITREKLKDAGYVAMLVADIVTAVERLER